MNTECDTGSDWSVVSNRKRRKTRVESKVEEKMHRSCDCETRNCTHTGTTSASVPSDSSVSPGVNTEVFPEICLALVGSGM